MRNLSNRSTDTIIAEMSQAIKADDDGKFVQLINELVENTREQLTAEQSAKLEALQVKADEAALIARGEKPLTSEEQKFFTASSKGFAKRYSCLLKSRRTPSSISAHSASKSSCCSGCWRI